MKVGIRLTLTGNTFHATTYHCDEEVPYLRAERRREHAGHPHNRSGREEGLGIENVVGLCAIT